LLGASSIGTVFVVGPAQPLRKVLHGLSDDLVIVEQIGKMLANTWAAIRTLEDSHKTADDDGVDLDRPLLLISSDLPLISPSAVDDFVTRCALAEKESHRTFSILGGVAEEASLTRYYPEDGKSGIIRPYVHFSQVRVRLANIYVARPRQLTHSEFLETGFSYRKAKDWHNVVKLVRSYFGRAGGWKAAWVTMKMQVTLMASRRGGKLYRRLRRANSVERIESAIGALLGGSIKMMITPYGGLSLDVDEEEDYRVLSERFEDWE